MHWYLLQSLASPNFNSANPRPYTIMTDTVSTPTSSHNNATAAASSILSEKVQRALQVRTDTPAIVAALEALDNLPSSSAAGEMDSRSVRVAIERDALHQAISLQQELQSLVETVTQLKIGVTSVSQMAQEISNTIHQNVVSTNNNTTTTENDALEQELRLATELHQAFEQQQQAKLRADTVAAFLEKFNLSPHHASLLDTYDFADFNQDGFDFLQALERVRKIRQELSSVNVFQQEEQLGATSAIRMMESLAQKQEEAYEKLYHWLIAHLQLHNNNAGNETSVADTMMLMDEALSLPFVRASLESLQHVPAFYSHLVEMICTARRIQNTKRFLLALTSGYEGQAPMELKAHDPVAYVGDMLAYCFQAASVEADNVNHVLIVQNNESPQQDDTLNTTNTSDSLESEEDITSQSSMTAEEMLAHATSGIARPLKSRILQVVASLARKEGQDDDDDDDDLEDDNEEGAIARSRVASLYTICGLLVYYRSALLKCVHQDATNPLVVAVMDCINEAGEAYAASLRVYAAMLDSLAILTGDSEAYLAQLLLQQLVQVRTTSPGFAAHVTCPKELQQPLSLEFMVETLLQAALSSCKTLDDAVTIKSCIATSKKAGLTVSKELETLVSEKEQTMIDKLVNEKTSHVLELCGLKSMATAWKNMIHVEGMTMSTQAGLTEEDVELGMKEFYSSLYAPPLPSFETIKDPVLRRLARSKICDNVCQVYEELYVAMKSEKGGYDDLSFLGHTPEQVKTLFSA